jgi:hypothetical protein
MNLAQVTDLGLPGVGFGPGRKKEIGLDLFAPYGLGEFLQRKEGGYHL